MWSIALLALCSSNHALGDARVMMMQVYPPHRSVAEMARSEERDTAVILIHGLDLRDDGEPAAQPRYQGWQGSQSYLVRSLADYADVFAIAYAQTDAVEDIAWYVGLRRAVAKVVGLGYKRVILVGHSAGGLIARHFVEDFPESGVSMVIQIATPNGGAAYAGLGVHFSQVPRDQAKFIASMDKHHRQTLMSSRRHRRIPPSVDFVTIAVARHKSANGDGVVSIASQWPRDLQLQRVPCIPVFCTHGRVMCNDCCVEAVASLVRTGQKRWSRRAVFSLRRRLGFVPQDR